MRSLLRRIGVLLFGLTAVVSCNDSNGPSTGQLSLLLKDAPGDILTAVVTVDEINLQGSGGTTILRSDPFTTDLLTLAADADTILRSAVVPSGSYSQLRFVISGAYIEVDNGDGTTSIYASSPDYAGLPPGATVAGNLQMPSLGTSGLKVNLPGDALVIHGGDVQILLLDFDVSQSFGHPAGNSGQWVMHPVINGASVTTTGGARVDLSLGQEVILPAGVELTGFTATLTGTDGMPRTAPFTAGTTAAVFSANFGFLAPGTYSVQITGPAGVASFTTDPGLPGSIEVVAGDQASVAFVITAAS